MKIRIFQILLASTLSCITYSLTLTLLPNVDRCMVSYTGSADDHLHLELKFTLFQGQTEKDIYTIRVINSENQSAEEFQMVQGIFRR